MKNLFAVCGSWGFGDVEKGITVYRYHEETGELTDRHHYDAWLSAGYQCYDAKRKVLYFVNEVDNRAGEAGGGGFVRAYRVDSEGGLSFLNEICVLLGKPCYLALAPTGDYILTACHASRGCVTKAVHDAKGNWISSVLYDDAGIALVRVNEDGSLGEVCDIALHTGLTKNQKQVHAHPHSIVSSPDGSVYYACDKGLDRIYGYRLDRDQGKLVPLGVTEMEYKTAPRYSAFHPVLPVWYENNEDGNKVWAFQYDRKTGALDAISAVAAGEREGTADILPSDIVIHPNGKVLYNAARKLANIALLGIAEDGTIALKGTFDTGSAVRGLCLSPDARFMLAACDREQAVKVFSIGEDGMLSDTGRMYEAAAAANVQIVEV